MVPKRQIYQEGTAMIVRLKVYFDGTKVWFLNDELHREDGPTVETPQGNKYFYIHGHMVEKK